MIIVMLIKFPIYKSMCKRDEQLHVSIVVSIPACHAGDRGSIPRRGVLFLKIIIETHCISGSAFGCEKACLTGTKIPH